MSPIQHIDGLLVEHHRRVSPLVLGFAVAISLSLVSPTLILAQTEGISLDNPTPLPVTTNQSGYNQGPPPAGYPTGPNSGPYQGMPGQSPEGQQGPMMGPPQGPQNGPMSGPQMPGPGPMPSPQNYSGSMNGGNDEQRQKMEAEGFKRMLSGMKGMEMNVKMFQKQIDKLKKQNINVPAETTEKIEKLNSIIKAVKESNGFEEAQKAGMDDLGELIQSLNEERGTLERLSKWPQTIKQASRMLSTLNRSLKQDKTIASRLQKNGYDISELVTNFESSIQKLTASRDSAAELIKTDPEAAFSELEDNFFGNFDEIMQSDKTIKELGSLSKFSASFKRNIADATKQIQKLKTKDLDTADLETILQDLKDKGNEITNLMKNKPIDTDAIVSTFEELDGLRQDFESAMNDLTGDDVPWEKGPSQFKQISPVNMNQYMPQMQAPTQGPMF